MTRNRAFGLVRTTYGQIAIWALILLLGTALLRWQVDLNSARTTPALGSGRLATGLAGLGAWFLAGLWWFQRPSLSLEGPRSAPAPGVRALSYGWGLAFLVLVGLVLRLTWLGSAPLFEDDAWRYLWDGALSANGQNPYVLPPQTVKIAPSFAGARDPFLAAQRALVEAEPDALKILYKINHPWLASLYPPVAQAIFAVAHWLAPYSISGFQILLMLWELMSLALFAVLLRAWGQPLYWLLGYWWNPLLIEEVANSLHMDALMLPFMALALLTMRWAQRSIGSALATVAVVLAAGVKIWPLVLLPVLAPWIAGRDWRANLARALGLGLLAGLATALVFWPMVSGILQGNQAQSGLVAYAQRWEMNDSLFMAAKGFWHQIVGLELSLAERVTRWMVAGLVAGLSLYFWRRGTTAPTAFLWVAALLFMTSPTQFPWYYIWLFPALLLRPVWPLLALSATLPLYYWRFQAQAQDWTPWFDQGLVWLEFGPILVWLAWLAIAQLRAKHMNKGPRRPRHPQNEASQHSNPS